MGIKENFYAITAMAMMSGALSGGYGSMTHTISHKEAKKKYHTFRKQREDEAPRKDSQLRCKFWNKHHEMVKAAVLYAEHCGYITVDIAASEKEINEIEAKYEALKPADCDAACTDAKTDNEAE